MSINGPEDESLPVGKWDKEKMVRSEEEEKGKLVK